MDAPWLMDLQRPYLWGANTYWRGVIAAALGELEESVILFRQAFSEGQRFWWWMVSMVEAEPLRDYPPFQELMRPKG
jgi:hypothetical protein